MELMHTVHIKIGLYSTVGLYTDVYHPSNFSSLFQCNAAFFLFSLGTELFRQRCGHQKTEEKNNRFKDNYCNEYCLV